MKIIRPAILLGGLTCIAMLPVTGHAQLKPFGASEVMRGCHAYIAQTVDESFDQGTCSGEVTVLMQFGPRFGICPPVGATIGQGVRVVVAYVDKRPARLGDDFTALAIEALKEAWPCKR
jgi:hypothetical protein